MTDKEKRESWAKPVAIIGLVGLLLIGGIAWLLLSKTGGKVEAVSQERLYSEEGVIMARQDVPTASTAQTSQAAPQSAGQVSAAPQQAPSNLPAPEPMPGGPPPEGAPAGAMPPGTLPAQASPDSPNKNQSQNQNQRRMSIKDRIEKTAPEDRARRQQLHVDEMKYRQAHGGGRGGGRP